MDNFAIWHYSNKECFVNARHGITEMDKSDCDL